MASSAFLIYLDPHHGTNSVRTLVLAQISAAALGVAALALFGPGYAAEDTLTLFALAVGLVALLVALERATLWLLGRLSRRPHPV